jgi:hypothetical protein
VGGSGTGMQLGQIPAMAVLENTRACILTISNPIGSELVEVSVGTPNSIDSMEILGTSDVSIRSRMWMYTKAASRSLAEAHMIVKKLRQTTCTANRQNTGGTVDSPHFNATTDTPFSTSQYVDVATIVAAVLYTDI